MNNEHSFGSSIFISYSFSRNAHPLERGKAAHVNLTPDSLSDLIDQSRGTLQSLVQSCDDCANRYHSLKLQETSIDQYSFEHIPTIKCKNNNFTEKNVENDSYSTFDQTKQPTISSDHDHQGTTKSIASDKIIILQKTNKARRLRWTYDLHKKFIESVNQLGGAKQATPKEILKLMDCEGLTIFHIKSHLQGYRVVQFMEEAREGPKLEEDRYSCDNNYIIPECNANDENESISESFRNNSISVENDHFSKFQQEKQPRVNRVTLLKAAKTNKTRIKWTNHLQNKFIESINRLGGATKATPMGILKLMNCEGLTIFHVKSHLQKYRIAQLMQEATKGPSFGSSMCDAFGNSRLENGGANCVEGLRLHLNVQQGLYKLIENQKKLQVRMEEQAKQLQILIQSQPS